MPRTLALEPLTQDGFAPFGDVIADREDVVSRPANFGTAKRRDWMAKLASTRPNAELNVATFACAPRALPLDIALMEKHPASTQIFVPMAPGRFIVVVAPGDESPRMNEARAFLAEGSMGVAYRPGCWHYPMLVLDSPLLFTCLVWEDRGSEDCVERALTPDEQRTIEGA